MAEYKQGGNQLKPLTKQERKYSEKNLYLVDRFLRIKRLNPEIYYDVIIFDYLLAVEIYLNNEELSGKCNFEAVSFKYMERALFNHYRAENQQKRKSKRGTDISFEDEEMENFIQGNSMEGLENLEYIESLKEIKNALTAEQGTIFSDKLDGYTLKEIAVKRGIGEKRIYKQFAKIKKVVAGIMGVA